MIIRRALGLLPLVFLPAVTGALTAQPAGEAKTEIVRTIASGQWDDPDIWERWNGAQWTPLLPTQYPGCRSLRKVHTQVNHKVVLPQGLEINVEEVTAAREEFVLVDGELIVDRQVNYADSSSSDAPAVAGTRVSSGIKVAPNPLRVERGGSTVTITFATPEEYQSARLRIYDESGNVLQEVKEWSRLAPGTHVLSVLLADLSTGVYHVSLEAPGVRRTHPITVVK